MKVVVLNFIKNVFKLKDDFSTYDFKSKHKSPLLSLFESIGFIEQTGSNRIKRYKKTEILEKIHIELEKTHSEEIAQLFLAFSILDSEKLPDKYNGKIIRSIFKTGAAVTTHLLFNAGFLHKNKRTYEYTQWFFHLNKQTKKDREKLFNALFTHFEKEEQQLYLSVFRSIKHKPDYVSISYDHGISLRIQWVLTHWKMGKSSKKRPILLKLEEENKKLIIFEAERSTRTAKAFITIFPRLSLEEEDELTQLILEKIKEKSMNLVNLEREFIEQKITGSTIHKKVIRLFLNNKIKFSEQIPVECQKLLEKTIDYQKKAIDIPITVKLDSNYFNFLKKNGFQNPQNQIERLVNENSLYLRFSPLTSDDHKGILTFKQIAPDNAFIIIN